MKLLARLALAAVVTSGAAAPAAAQIDARMFRYPDVSADPDRLRVRGRHLDRAEDRRRGHPAELTRRRGDVPALLARRATIAYSANYDGNLDVYVVAATRRRAGAAHAPPDGRPRGRLASRRQARAVRLGPRERAPALQPVLPGAGNRRPAREAAGAVRRVRRVLGRRRDASRTCRSRRTSARGSGTAAAGRPTSGCSTCKTMAASNITNDAANDAPADVARRHDLLPLGPRARRARRTSGRWIRRPAPRGR